MGITKARLYDLLGALVIGVAIGAGAVLALASVGEAVKNSQFRARAVELWSGYSAWVRAGRPAGEDLKRFVQTLEEPRWVLVDNEKVIDGVPHRILLIVYSSRQAGNEHEVRSHNRKE
jgi:hypothetical protein